MTPRTGAPSRASPGWRTQKTNPLAIAVSTIEAKASLLPGRVNGPADAYRHIVWVGEMARRLGPNNAGRYAELHEIQGQASAMRRDAFGQSRDPINDEGATAMDRRNNLIGVSIGQRARSFDEVLRMARETIDRSPTNGSGGVAGAVWLPKERWLANPSPDEALWNWPHPNWSKVSRQHVQDYGWASEKYRFVDYRLPAAERRAALAAEKQSEWTLLLQEDEASDGLVHVRAHQRDGHPVRAYTRSPP